MDNTKFSTEFLTYLGDIKKNIEYCYDDFKKNGINKNVLDSIISLDFRAYEVDANIEYFYDCFLYNSSVENVLINLKYNEDELYRKLEDFTDSLILNEVSRRNMDDEIISDAWTSELEDELENRYDTSMVRKSQITVEELREMLIDRGCYSYASNNKKAIICELIGLNNSFAYNNKEMIDAFINFINGKK